MNKLVFVAVLFCLSTSLAVAQSRVEVAAGKDFTITLVSNPTTGYQWELSQPVDEAKVKFVKSTFVEPPETKGTDKGGASGLELWVFRAVAIGESTISMKYVRSWDKESAPKETATINVSIK